MTDNTTTSMEYQGEKFETMDFDPADLRIGNEGSKYPFEEMPVGKGFLIRKPQASVSGRVSSFNKKSDKIFKSKQTTNPSHGESAPGAKDGASKEEPFTWVVRVR